MRRPATTFVGTVQAFFFTGVAFAISIAAPAVHSANAGAITAPEMRADNRTPFEEFDVVCICPNRQRSDDRSDGDGHGQPADCPRAEPGDLLRIHG